MKSMDKKALLEKAQALKTLQLEKESRLKAQSDFSHYCNRIWPGYIMGKSHAFVAKILEKAVRRENGFTRLVIHQPPQHGKSLQISTLFPSWYLGLFPEDPAIITAYADGHASSFSRNIRNIIDSPDYQNIFPGMHLSSDSRAANRWELDGHRGSMCAAGLSGQITGKGAKLIIIDDPVKNREDVESKLKREKMKEAYLSTLYTRLHDDGIVICVMTRWHMDDLAGYLIREHDFSYICLPALAEENDPLNREVGEPLWPERFPLRKIFDFKEQLGSYNFNALYQGRPQAEEGECFKRDFFKIVSDRPRGLNWVRFWDLATSEQQRSDYTATGAGAVDEEGNVYIDGVFRKRMEWPKVRNKIKQYAKMEPGVLVGIEAQGPQKGMVQECWADPDLLNVGILGIPAPLSKRIRASSAMARGEAGKLYLVSGSWNKDFVDECVNFDTGDHDDQVDVLSGIFHMLGMSHGGAVSLDELLEEENNELREDFDYSTYLDDLDFEGEGLEFDDMITPMVI